MLLLLQLMYPLVSHPASSMYLFAPPPARTFNKIRALFDLILQSLSLSLSFQIHGPILEYNDLYSPVIGSALKVFDEMPKRNMTVSDCIHGAIIPAYGSSKVNCPVSAHSSTCSLLGAVSVAPKVTEPPLAAADPASDAGAEPDLTGSSYSSSDSSFRPDLDTDPIDEPASAPPKPELPLPAPSSLHLMTTRAKAGIFKPHYRVDLAHLRYCGLLSTVLSFPDPVSHVTALREPK
ncbi:unnamed protein product [Lactuca saligna]|uniref:Uncharacterized protein n=1 Tax=Lactuca saligna TaxID=75948 RepID=A0AA35ZZZ9_LACSI|nr:unnamed protein product [Lactuca saligna]